MTVGRRVYVPGTGKIAAPTGSSVARHRHRRLRNSRPAADPWQRQQKQQAVRKRFVSPLHFIERQVQCCSKHMAFQQT